MTRVELPEGHADRWGIPTAYEPLDLGSGPRPIPAWSRGAAIRFRWHFGNRPDFILRCRFDPLRFTRDGSPVWRPDQYIIKPGDDGWSRGITTGWRWVAEQDGVAAVHYHSGPISMQTFEETVTDRDGKAVWIEKPDWCAGKPGKRQTQTFEMLATSQQEGYGGRAFDITLDECDIVISGKLTRVPAGTRLRLRGPWHSAAPEGFSEVSYWIDEREEPWCGRGKRRPWHERGGYFGLYVQTSVLLDIFATHLPHIEWVVAEFERDGKVRRSIEPLVPETRMPKGWAPDSCPGHKFLISQYSNWGPQPGDRCRFCNAQRDPAWRYIGPLEQAKLDR